MNENKKMTKILSLDNKKIKKYKRIYSELKDSVKSDLPVEVVGDNWSLGRELPIAIFIGFNPWKRTIFSSLFNEYRCCFTRGYFNWFSIYRDFLIPLGVNELTVFTWGNKDLPITVKIWIKINRNKIKIKHGRIEDGFLRTIGRGQLHTTPGSLCIDYNAIYFDSNRVSDLEKIIIEKSISENTDYSNRVSRCIGLFKAARATKYYDLDVTLKLSKFERRDNYSVLVVGQVEDDASLVYGRSKFKNNLDLVKYVRKNNPDSDIYYKPHPDYIFGNRKSKSKHSEIERVAKILPPETNLSDVIREVDHIYTMTSLTGMEALIYGKKVTVCGNPFYSGWGLSEDLNFLKRRGGYKKTIKEVFSSVYLDYSKYFHLISGERIEFEEQVSYFLMEVLKYTDIFNLHKNSFYNEVKEYIDFLSTPVKLLDYISTTNLPSCADGKIVENIIDQNFKLRDFPQISFILIKTANYDSLVKYINKCLKLLELKIDSITTFHLSNFFDALKVCLKNTNGRVINLLPDLCEALNQRSSKDPAYQSVVIDYIECLSMNIQYDLLEKVLMITIDMNRGKSENIKLYENISDKISRVNKFEISESFLLKIISRLNAKPSRSERNYHQRYNILKLVLSKYKDKLLVLNDYDLATAKYLCAKGQKDELLKHVSSKLQSSTLKLLQKPKYCCKWLGVCEFILKNSTNKRDVVFVEKVVSQIKSSQFHERVAYLELALVKKNSPRFIIEKTSKLLEKFPNNERLRSFYARELRNKEEFILAYNQYEILYTTARTISKKKSVSDEMEKIDFCITASEFINSIPQPAVPKGVVFLASQNCLNSLAMLLPSLYLLKKRGYVIVNLIEGVLERDFTLYEYINKFHGVIPSSLVSSNSLDSLSNTWKIDWENKKVISNGINFYQALYERLSTYIRSYYVDIKEGHVFKEFKNQILRADLALSICNSIYEELVLGKNINVTFVTSNSHVTPYSIFRDFARNKNHPRLGFINCNVAYESYFANLGSNFSSTMCVTDMTLYPNIRAPFFARRDQFEAWYEKNKTNLEYIEQADKLINVNRVHSDTDERQKELISQLKKWKSNGYKIVCAFGKVPVDLNVPYDGGPAHEDMADWLNHTVSICSGVEKLILLVKPHPHELKPQIALDLIEGFNDLVTVNYDENIKLLGHRDINVHALAPFLDLAVLYNGSSSLELTAMGVPVVMAAYFGKHDYPIDLIYPDSRSQYEEFILSGVYPVPSNEVRKKAAFLICYMGTEEISVKNDYSLRQLTNDKVGVPQWRKKRLIELQKFGDPCMELIADRIVEKFESNNK